MVDYIKRQIEPACKFGPGGDFVSHWPGRAGEPQEVSTNRLGRVLASIGEIITTLIGLAPEQMRVAEESILYKEGKSGYAVTNIRADRGPYTTSATIIKGNRLFPGEPLLFADDSRISVRTGHKPKHRIRTYQRASKKRSSFSLPGQGSLFETDLKSARTA